MLGSKILRTHWPFPKANNLDGKYVQLRPLSQDHLSDLWAAARGAPNSFDYLRYGPFETPEALSALIENISSRNDQPFWAVINQSGTACGWLSIEA